MGYTNADIIPAANRGISRMSANGSFRTVEGNQSGLFTGYLPHSLAAAFKSATGRITQTIYSYATPIAWKIDNVWIIPDVSYSMTTSSKHASQLWNLYGRREYVPFDATADDIDRIVAGLMRYERASNRNTVGRYVAA